MGLFEFLWAYALVFLFAAIPFFEAIVVIPIGILAGLSSIPVMILALLGNMLTVLLVVILASKIKHWKKTRQNENDKYSQTQAQSKRSLRAKHLWKKYGLPGLTIIGTMLLGSHLTAFMSISLGGTKKSAIIWMTISLVIWSIVVALLAHLGAGFIFDRTGVEGFLLKYFQQ